MDPAAPSDLQRARDQLRRRATDLLNAQLAEQAEEILLANAVLLRDDADLRGLLAHASLMQGKLREGFREWQVRAPRMEIVARNFPFPEWDGPLAGRSILFFGEQGLGDEIQTARFLPVLRDLGAARIFVACHPENVEVFRQLGADAVANRLAPEFRLPRPDCWVKAWSIPYHLGLTVADLSGKPYLTAEPAQPSGGIGLVERGNPRNGRDVDRSMPEGLLQAAVPQGRLMQPRGDTADSLRQLAGLDLLITVDTAWAHMAGALGVPCWVLLPHRNLDWRWFRERTDSPWYDSLRLFRQPRPGDWASVLDQVRAALG